MNIIQQPDPLSLSLNLKEFLITSDIPVSFILRQGGVEILSQRYDPPASGSISINVRDIIHDRLSYTLKDVGEVYQQFSLVDNFTAIIDTTEVTFRVIRSGVDRLADTASNFLTQNFLTWQPSTKPVTYYSPEFLTYYAVVSCKAKMRAYFTDDSGSVISQTDYTIANLLPNIAYTIPLQYSVVAGWLGHKLPAYYDVWIENSVNQRLTYIQRYYAEDMRTEQEQWVLFENSLGGLDTFRAYGNTTFNSEHTHNLAEIDDVSQEYRVDTERKFQKNTGYLNSDERRWLLDFFPSKVKYLYTDSYIRSIVVIESDVRADVRTLPSSYSFTYKYADARPLLNFPQKNTPAKILNITVPNVGSFTIPPRLAEFPRLQLTDGVLFPTQNPYSEGWGTTSLGMLGNFISQRFEVYKSYKGYYSTEALLLSFYPKSEPGWHAFVGIPWPGTVYECGFDKYWFNTGKVPVIGDDIFIELLKRHIDGLSIYWDNTNKVIRSSGGTSATYTITVNIDASSISKCTIEATGDVVSITPLADGSSYSVVGNADGMVTVKIVTEAGYQVKELSVDQVVQGAISEYIFDKLTIDHTMYIILEEASTEFLERSDLPGYYYSSMQDALNAVRATYPDGLTKNVTISCIKMAREKRKNDHYIASLSNWNQRSIYSLTIDGNNDLYLNGKSLGCLSFSSVDNLVIRDIHFEDYSNYVGYQVPDALGAISFTGKASKYARNLFVGGCTFNGKSMTNEEIMSTNSVILIDTENVTINNSSFINGCGPIVNADNSNLLSILNNDFEVASIGVGYPTAVTVSSGKMVIMEDNRMSGDNRYSFVSITNIDKAYIRRNTFKDGGSMALSISSSIPMSKLVLESNLFAGMLSNTTSINTWAQAVVGLCPIRDMELNNNTFYMSGNNGQQYCTRWGSVSHLKMYNNVVVDAKHAVNFVYGFAFNDVGELFSDHNVFQYKVHNNVTYGSLIRVYNSEGIEGAVEINADQGCRFAQIQALGYDTHSVLVSDGVDANALDSNMMITSVLDNSNPANNANVPAIDLAYKSKSASVNSRGCYNLHGSVINETIVVDGYTGYNMESDGTFSDATQYSSMAEDTLLLMSKSLNRNLMPSFSIEGPTDRFLIIGRYGLLSPIPILDENGEYVEDELYDITIE